MRNVYIAREILIVFSNNSTLGTEKMIIKYPLEIHTVFNIFENEEICIHYSLLFYNIEI